MAVPEDDSFFRWSRAARCGRGCAVDIRARHREARYNAPRDHFISYCRELRHGTAELDVRELAEQAAEGAPNGR